MKSTTSVKVNSLRLLIIVVSLSSFVYLYVKVLLLESQLSELRSIKSSSSIEFAGPSKAIAAKKLSPAEEKSIKRHIYGGSRDPVHVGGFTSSDIQTQSTNVWNMLLGSLAVRSVIDVGCGRGFSASYFHSFGAKVLCIEGSSDAIAQSFLSRDQIVEHDYTLGPYWPEETYDACYSTEFLVRPSSSSFPFSLTSSTYYQMILSVVIS